MLLARLCSAAMNPTLNRELYGSRPPQTVISPGRLA